MADQSGPTALLRLRGISKHFGKVQANQDIALSLHRGEILGLLGENGAGKTTLMNILFGLYRPDAGTLEIEGRAVSFASPAEALACGIGMVHQHFHLVPRHSVLENLMVGQRGLRLDRATARRRLAELGERFGLRLEPERLASSLTVGEQQRLEIIKALFRGARVLILDEPTSVLTPQESEGLFDALRGMAKSGVGIIFISHKLQEVRAITDRVAVLRRGRLVAEIENRPDLTNRELAELMCGHDLTPPSIPAREIGAVLLELDRLSTPQSAARPVALDQLSLQVRGGEILGIAGISGNGQRELADVIAGILRPSAGALKVSDKAVKPLTASHLRALGVACVPEDRMGEGLLVSLPLSDSMVLPHIGRSLFSRFGWLKRAAIGKFVEEQIETYDIATAGKDARTGTLSGGNQQKALLARELAFEPLVLLVAQPTRGLDVSAREFVHRLFLALRNRGRAVIMISEDLEELFEISDRIAVMYEGAIVADLPRQEADVSGIGLLMAGVGQAA